MTEQTKRATIYLDSELHRALRARAEQTNRSMSDLVNEAVRVALLEDAEDLAAFKDRADEPAFSFAEVVRDIKRRDKL